jgi:hypothetical protein
VNVGGNLGQARTLRSIGPVQFDLVVIHSVQNSPTAQIAQAQRLFRDSTKLGQKNDRVL